MISVVIFDKSIKSKKPEWYTAQCDRRHTSFWRDSCTKENDEHHNPFGLTWPEMVTNECNVQPNTSNAWWGSELDILEARGKDDIMSTNIHAGGYKGSAGCYFNGHKGSFQTFLGKLYLKNTRIKFETNQRSSTAWNA